MENYFDIIPEDLLIQIIIKLHKSDVANVRKLIRFSNDVYKMYLYNEYGKIGYLEVLRIKEKYNHPFERTFYEILFNEKTVKIPIVYKLNIIGYIPILEFNIKDQYLYVIDLFKSNIFNTYNYVIIGGSSQLTGLRRKNIDGSFSWVVLPSSRQIITQILVADRYPYAVSGNILYQEHKFLIRRDGSLGEIRRLTRLNHVGKDRLDTIVWLSQNYPVESSNETNANIRSDINLAIYDKNYYYSDMETYHMMNELRKLDRNQLADLIRRPG